MANTIQDKLAYLEQTKGLIKEAIVAKGVSVSESDTFRSYANKIEAIQSGGGTVNLPDGTKFANSTFTTVPSEIIPYLEAQTDMSYMFYLCQALKTVPHFDTSRVTSTDSMFNGCWNLQTVPQFDTSSIISTNSMFSSCSSLQTVPLLNLSKVTKIMNINRMFDSCSSLTNLGGFTGLKVNLYLASSPKLTVDSIMNIINNAADMTSSPKTLTLHQDVFNKLSEEQIATASAKGWNIASA